MLYELRSYRVSPGRFDEVLENAVRYANPLQAEHGFDLVGFWTVVSESSDGDFDLVYLLRWESEADRERKWASFVADPKWVARQADKDAEVPLIAGSSVQFLAPTAFSGLQ
jgi:heme-degrading monooxygenase HmoA